MNEAEGSFLKKLKRNIFGKPQTIQAIFPPGFGAIALAQTQKILDALWFPQKYSSMLTLEKNSIRIENIHPFAITELLIRSQCLSDIRLLIYTGKTFGNSAFEKKCREIEWEYYLNKKMTVKIKVKSIASRAFHETGLKKILSDIVKDYVCAVIHDETEPTTTLYAELYKEKLALSISLAGESLYKRGYREALSKSAPLREDSAACCLQQALHFMSPDFSPSTLFIPFSGTGTFLFEYLIDQLHIPPVLFERDYALMDMPIYREENFQYLLKKAKEQPNGSMPSIICIDNSETASASLHNNATIFNKTFALDNQVTLLEEDFFKINLESLLAKIQGDIFMPINPPYGIRLNSNTDSTAFYKKIATTIKRIAALTPYKLGGFILCPTLETWSGFSQILSKDNAIVNTYHFTQGGLDIRVCQFYYGKP